MTNTITINLIPEDYKGNPHEALGYAWQDLKNRIPGTDVIGNSLEDALAVISNNIGEFEVINFNDYNAQGEPIALINAMWCGGQTYVVIPKPAKVTLAPLLNSAIVVLVDTGLEIKHKKSAKEQAYDDLYNEGAEGYNPYRD